MTPPSERNTNQRHGDYENRTRFHLPFTQVSSFKCLYHHSMGFDEHLMLKRVENVKVQNNTKAIDLTNTKIYCISLSARKLDKRSQTTWT